MTSKTLFHNLLLDDIRRKRGLFIIALISFIFINPISTMMYIERLMNSTEIESMARIRSYCISQISFSYWGNSVLPVILSVILAVVSFSFLFSKKKTDLYHSLPVKRETLFFSRYLSGVLIFAVIMLVSSLLNITAMGIKGFSDGQIWMTAGSTFLYALLYFLLFYNLSIAAVMLTGNFWISLAAIGVLFFYIPAVIEIMQGYFSNYMATYYICYGELSTPSILLTFISPVYSLFSKMGENFTNVWLRVLVTILSAVLLLAADIWLYKKRPSESSGHALSFPKCESFIRFFITVPFALLGGYYIVSMFPTLSSFWFWFTFLFAGAICHCLLEVLLHFDFRAILKHKLQFLLSLAAAVLIALCFQYDWIGYDSYLPQSSKVEYAAVCFDNIDSDKNALQIKKEDSVYSVNYNARDILQLGNMKLYNVDDVLSLAQIGIEQSDEQFEKRNTYNNVRRNLFLGTYSTSTGIGYEEEPALRFSVRYHLKSGKDIYRNYAAKTASCLDAAAKIYNDAEYKKCAFQVDDLYETGIIKQIDGYNIWGDKAMSVSGSDLNRFFEAYIADLDALTIQDKQKETPIIRLDATCDKQLVDNDIDLYGYYIYPSFSQTLQVLEELGVSMDTLNTTINKDNIVSIHAYSYSDNYDKTSECTYLAENETDKEKINSLADHLVIDSFASDSEVLNPTDSHVSFELQYVLDNGLKVNTYASVKVNDIPDFIIEDLGLTSEK